MLIYYFVLVDGIFLSTWRIFGLHGKNILERFFVAHKKFNSSFTSSSLMFTCSHSNCIDDDDRGKVPFNFCEQETCQISSGNGNTKSQLVNWLFASWLVSWFVAQEENDAMVKVCFFSFSCCYSWTNHMKGGTFVQNLQGLSSFPFSSLNI